jgi:hypothetical protein
LGWTAPTGALAVRRRREEEEEEVEEKDLVQLDPWEM